MTANNTITTIEARKDGSTPKESRQLALFEWLSDYALDPSEIPLGSSRDAVFVGENMVGQSLTVPTYFVLRYLEIDPVHGLTAAARGLIGGVILERATETGETLVGVTQSMSSARPDTSFEEFRDLAVAHLKLCSGLIASQSETERFGFGLGFFNEATPGETLVAELATHGHGRIDRWIAQALADLVV